MQRVRRLSAGSVILAMLLACLLPVTVSADGLNIGVNVNVGGSGGLVSGNINVGGTNIPVGNGSTGTGGAANVNANVNVGGNGSVATGNANATVGSGGSATTVNGNATVGGNTGNSNGSVANVDVKANVGGGGTSAGGGGSVANVDVKGNVGGSSNGSVANVDVKANVGGGSVATTDTSANVGNSGGPTNNGGGGAAGIDTNTKVGNDGSVATVNGCVQVGTDCNTPPTTVSVGGTPLVGANACVVVDGNCTTTPTSNPPAVGVNACVAVGGVCNGSTTPNGTGIGIGGTGTTPIGDLGLCVVILDSCGTLPAPGGTTPGGTTPGGTTPGGTTPGNPLPGGLTPGNPAPGSPIPGGPIPGSPNNPLPGNPTNPGIPVGPNLPDATTLFAKAPVTLNAQDTANPALCAIPLTAFSRDATMSSTLVDCATVHVSGNRSVLPAGYGQTQDSATAGAATATLGNSGTVLTDVSGTCVGCETAFGSGSGYRAFVQLKDQASGDFLNVGIVHDASAAATGENNAAGLTLVVETGRKTANGYDVSQGFIATDANRVPGGHASILVSWGATGVTVSVNGVVLPNENAARAVTIGTYMVRMTQPVIGFNANAKNPGERVDATFKSISFG